MFIRKLVIGTALVLALGTSTIAYAKVNNSNNTNVGTQEQRRNGNNKGSMRNSMLTMMEENGYSDLAQDIRNGDYEAMDDYMNNLSDEDYQKMIDVMKENGYADMAARMESIGKDGMISMHNAMSGSGGCHR